ncbi:MAG: hypothetical protein AAFQ82_21375 [Myxococcota bacterium]
MAKHALAREVARFHSDTAVFIDHAQVLASDHEWLAPVEHLTLWNVKLPERFLATLLNLKLLDIRGGSGETLSLVEGCASLDGLVVNQIRGLHNVDALVELTSLRLLSLYGLPKVVHVPSLQSHVQLTRLELGSMKNLESAAPLLKAPNLRELLLSRKMRPGSIDAELLSSHPSLEQFLWFAVDVPKSQSGPIIDAITLPQARSILPEKWLKANPSPIE